VSLFIPCSACGEREPGKLCSATWAWWRADNKRTAWRQNLCVKCYILRVQPLEMAIGENPLSCPVCHTDAGAALDITYLTCFVPGLGPLRLEMGTCAACAVTIRLAGQENARKLEDRLTKSEGQDPGPQTDPALEAWRALGIAPRD